MGATGIRRPMAPIPRARSVGPGHAGLATDAAVADPMAGDLVRHRPTHRVRRPPPLGEHIHHPISAWPPDLNAQIALCTTPALKITLQQRVRPRAYAAPRRGRRPASAPAPRPG